MKITIDPGINGTGWALWKSWKLVDTGIFYAPAKLDWIEKCQAIESKCIYLERENPITDCYLEYPAYFDSVGGNMVAKRGDLLKLTFLVGLIYAVFLKSHLIPVRTWKGQLPKDVVIQRIKQLLPPETYMNFKTHVWDAVGIGLHVKGDFL